MGSGIYLAMSAAVVQSEALDVVANNIANSATPGFQAEKLTFGEVLTNTGTHRYPYVAIDASHIDQHGGSITRTGNPLDLALQGQGYFGINTPNGVRYTRAGNFQVDPQHRILMTHDGMGVRAQGGGEIQIPATTKRVNVAEDGTVSADGALVGQLELSRFNGVDLVREGASRFLAKAPPQAGPPPTVVAEALEGSNMNSVRGMVEMIHIMRTHQAAHTAMEHFKELDERAARAGSG